MCIPCLTIHSTILLSQQTEREYMSELFHALVPSSCYSLAHVLSHFSPGVSSGPPSRLTDTQLSYVFLLSFVVLLEQSRI